MVDLACSYGIIEMLLDARRAPSNHAAPAASAASVDAGHANAIAGLTLPGNGGIKSFRRVRI